MILLAVLGLIGAIICLVFMIIGFANGRNRGAFAWMGGVLLSIAGIVTCSSLLGRKVARKINEVQETFGTNVAATMDSLSRGMEDSRTYVLGNNKQVELLKSYTADTVNEQFYTYFGFRDYYRFPLRYPYAIHCIDLRDNGYLFNEKDVKHFDQSDNGDIDLGIPGIKRIAFDQKFLLIEQQNEVSGKEGSAPGELSYLLFEFGKEQARHCKTLEDLVHAAHQKGYAGPDTLMTIEDYDKLF